MENLVSNVKEFLKNNAPEYLAMWQNYANFSDRTTKRGYWMAVLVNIIVTSVLSVIIGIIPELAFISGLYALATMVPGVALSVRRLNDTGKTWTYIFMGFIPLAGPIILLVQLCKDSAPVNEMATV